LSFLKLKLPESIVFMVSAIIEESQLDEYIANGAHSYINKPVNLKMLLDSIREVLKL
jgi:DNA-binding response OmpR family regulator